MAFFPSKHIACVLSRFSRVHSLRPRGPQPTRLLCPWDSPGKNTGGGCHFQEFKLTCSLISLFISWLDFLGTPEDLTLMPNDGGS